MGFTYEDETLTLSYKGVDYTFRAPSVIEQRKLGKAFKEADEGIDAFDLYINFFKELGLPEEVLSKMSMKGIISLFEYAVGVKKN